MPPLSEAKQKYNVRKLKIITLKKFLQDIINNGNWPIDLIQYSLLFHYHAKNKQEVSSDYLANVNYSVSSPVKIRFRPSFAINSPVKKLVS